MAMAWKSISAAQPANFYAPNSGYCCARCHCCWCWSYCVGVEWQYNFYYNIINNGLVTQWHSENDQVSTTVHRPLKGQACKAQLLLHMFECTLCTSLCTKWFIQECLVRVLSWLSLRPLDQLMQQWTNWFVEWTLFTLCDEQQQLLHGRIWYMTTFGCRQ